MERFTLPIKVLKVRADCLLREIEAEEKELERRKESIEEKKQGLYQLHAAIDELGAKNKPKHTWNGTGKQCCDGGCHACIDNGVCCEEVKANGGTSS